MNLSVIICTHNPRDQYLGRTLDALKAQSLPTNDWELLLVDNASEHPLSQRWNLSWHPNARHVREDELGLTCARLRGLHEARGDILVFVDDDNLVAPDYLEQVQQIFADNPFLGVLGGKIVGEYEVPPPPWAKRFLGALAIVDRGERELYALHPGIEPFLPYGAGMAIRRCVGLNYAQQIRHDPIRRLLDPVGDQLSRAGDLDLAMCAFDVSLAKGYYPQLKVNHLIPAGRLHIDYLKRLFEEGEHSRVSLLIVRGLLSPPQTNVGRRWARRVIERLRECFFEKHHAQLARAIRTGQKRAFADYAKLKKRADIAPSNEDKGSR